MVHTMEPFPREMEANVDSGECDRSRTREDQKGYARLFGARVPAMRSALELESIDGKAELGTGQNEHDTK
jgi:hypothetical protein